MSAERMIALAQNAGNSADISSMAECAYAMAGCVVLAIFTIFGILLLIYNLIAEHSSKENSYE